MNSKKDFDANPLIAELIDGVVGFFRGQVDPALSGYKEKNKLNSYFIIAAPIIIGLIANILPDTIGADMLGLKKIIFRSDDPSLVNISFASNFMIKSPFILFGVYSAISFWILFNRYVSVVHDEIVCRTSWIAALAIFLCFVFIYTSIFFTPFKPFLLIFILSYFVAWFFSWTLRAYIAKGLKYCKENGADPGKLTLMSQTTKGWLYVNSLVGVFWCAFYAMFPLEDFLIQNDVTHIVWKFSWIVIALLVTSIMVSGIRSAAFSFRVSYIDEVKNFNKAFEKVNNGNNQSTEKENLLSPAEEEVPPLPKNMSRSIVFLKGFAKTTRLAGSMAASLLIYASVSDYVYSVVSFIFLTFSFAYNDYVDHKKDNIGHPDRAIPSGLLSRKMSLFIAISLLTLGLLSLLLVNLSNTILFLILYAGSIFYSFLLKKYLPSIATPLWSLMITLMVSIPSNFGILEIFAIYSFFYGRELLLDYRDISSDLLFCKHPSLPAILKNKTYIFVSVLSMSTSICLFYSEMFIASSVALFVSLSIICLYMLQTSKNNLFSSFPALKYADNLMLACFPLILLLG